VRFEFHLKDMNFYGELLYLRNEHSMLYKPHNPNIGVGILCGYYTELGAICETGEVIDFSGFNPQLTWIPMAQKMPKSQRGLLLVHIDTDKPLTWFKGECIEYDRSWETYYNKKESCVCIGKDCHILDTDNCIEFANGIIAVLRGNQLVSVWAKIKEVESLSR